MGVKCCVPAKDTQLKRRRVSKSKTDQPVQEPPINRLIMNGIPEPPAETIDSELNTWIHLSSTRESGRNYPLEVAAKLGELDHNLRRGNFSIVHLI